MERLRAAIEQARKSRAENGAKVPPQPPSTTAKHHSHDGFRTDA